MVKLLIAIKYHDIIVAAQSSLDWGDKVITQNHPTHHKLNLHKQKVT